uniref:Uncharacterized protein n=1 Tax=Kwoniella dejecticola CBS 10117 TaxID=1296121 RepID=A0A1A6AC59_9TREE|nr:uncharacterized protein I303_01864 [Kwoniella dejecticola CBS 10117]OBR87656.1 hypothetical protein I303_01864 [Kwoniella dejecticola CBS 10117]
MTDFQDVGLSLMSLRDFEWIAINNSPRSAQHIVFDPDNPNNVTIDHSPPVYGITGRRNPHTRKRKPPKYAETLNIRDHWDHEDRRKICDFPRLKVVHISLMPCGAENRHLEWPYRHRPCPKLRTLKPKKLLIQADDRPIIYQNMHSDCQILIQSAENIIFNHYSLRKYSYQPEKWPMPSPQLKTITLIFTATRSSVQNFANIILPIFQLQGLAYYLNMLPRLNIRIINIEAFVKDVVDGKSIRDPTCKLKHLLQRTYDYNGNKLANATPAPGCDQRFDNISFISMPDFINSGK